jgi:DNA polymerase-3 subunit delta
MNLKTDKKIAFIGSDSFIDKYISDTLAEYKEYDLDKRTFFADEIDLDDFVNFISTFPLFSDFKLSIVKRAEKFKKLEDLLDLIARSESFIILASNDEKLIKILKKKKEFEIIQEPKKDKYSILNEIISYFKDLEIGLSKSTAEDIYEMCGKDMKVVLNELEKLKIYYKYKKPQTESEILEKIHYNKPENAFAFIDSYFDKNKQKASSILYKMIDNNENLNSLFYLLVKRLQLVSAYKIDPSLINERGFIMEKIKKNANNWSIQELSKYSDLIFQIDSGLKLGKIDIRNGLILSLKLLSEIA